MNNILPIIADTNFNRLGVLEDYMSMIWTPRFYTTGDFEICTNITEQAIDFIKIGYYVIRADDENVGIIEDVNIQVNDDGAEILVATGRFLGSILERRIVAQQTQFTNQTVGAVIFGLIDQNIINPTITERAIPNFILGEGETLGPEITKQITGDNIMNAISELCQTYSLGFKITLNDDNQFVFDLYEGTDRSYDQSANPYVIFSPDYDNVMSLQYEENYQGVKTNVLVAGEGEGLDRKTTWVGNSATAGLERYEVYKDARDLSSNNGEIPEATYMEQLAERGQEDLVTFTTAFTGEVDFSGIEYRKDVNLGDIVTIENKRWGVSMNCRLVEIIESVDETGAYTINPTFGE